MLSRSRCVQHSVCVPEGVNRFISRSWRGIRFRPSFAHIQRTSTQPAAHRSIACQAKSLRRLRSESRVLAGPCVTAATSAEEGSFQRRQTELRRVGGHRVKPCARWHVGVPEYSAAVFFALFIVGLWDVIRQRVLGAISRVCATL
jgi:hypothetical protein